MPTLFDEQILKLIGSPALAKAESLTAYGGFSLLVLSQAEVKIQFQSETRSLKLVVVLNGSTSLLRRDWIQSFPRFRIWYDIAPIKSVLINDSNYVTVQ